MDVVSKVQKFHNIFENFKIMLFKTSTNGFQSDIENFSEKIAGGYTIRNRG